MTEASISPRDMPRNHERYLSRRLVRHLDGLVGTSSLLGEGQSRDIV